MLRRTALALGLALTLLSAALWAASLWRITWQRHHPGEHSAALWSGTLDVANMRTYAPDGLSVFGFDTSAVRWWPHKDRGFLYRARVSPDMLLWSLTLPLWMPTLLGLALASAAYLPGRRARAWTRRGLCPTCGYDLRPASTCPECGAPAPN